MAIKMICTALLKRTPLFLWLRELHSYVSRTHRTIRMSERKDLDTLAAQIDELLCQSLAPAGTAPKKVLIMGMGRVRFIAMESPVRKAFELAGYECHVMVPQDRMVIEAYRKLGSDGLIFPDDYRSLWPASIPKVFEQCESLDELVSLEIDGVRCGKYAASTLMRKKRSGDFNFKNAEEKGALQDALRHSLTSLRMAKRILDAVKPDALVLVDRGYSPSGEFFDLCIARGIPVFTWNAAHRNNTLMLKRYTNENRDAHPASLSPKTWDQVKTMPWDETHWQRVLEELRYCYRSGEWYGEVGTQVNKQVLSKEALFSELGLDPNKKTFVIFPHIFWDATFFWGEDLFSNYEEWFIETVRVACKNQHVNWVIKVHPANLVKDARDGVNKEHSEIAAIRKAVGDLPAHVKLLKADTKLSTLSLFEAMDGCVTVRGTVGIEAACFGVPVLTAGTGRFDRLGFTIDSNSREEYLGRVAMAENLGRMQEGQVELARRYAHAFLLQRPLMLTCMQMRYQQTAAAELDIEYRVHTKEALIQSVDLCAIANWINSVDEDFLTSDAAQ